MNKGLYSLMLECKGSQNIEIGALGKIRFSTGWYIYIGSALGSGGLSRVSRHIRFYYEHYRKPKWHIDYLMAAEKIYLRKVMCAKTELDLECVLASAIDKNGIPAFGCSDCSCKTHLFFRREMPEKEVLKAFERVGLCGVVHEVD